MKTNYRKYDPDNDFLQVRDFLVNTFALTEKPLNWKLERWNYGRYFIAPMLVTAGIGEPDLDAVGAAIQLWNDTTGIWQDENGEIVGVVNIEHADQTHPGWGEVFIQHHPDCDTVLPEMLEYAESHLRNEEKNLVYIPIYDYDHTLISATQARGYEKIEKYTIWDSIFSVGKAIPKPVLPDGYSIRSMADEDSDLDKRRKTFGVGFNHPDPKDWPSRYSYQSLQQAPNYRADLDVYVVAPEGEYAACCIGWWDAMNKIACLEPVATAPAYRRKGLGRAVVMEAIHRVAALGAEQVFVGSDQEFYLALGFELAYPAHHWVKRFK